MWWVIFFERGKEATREGSIASQKKIRSDPKMGSDLIYLSYSAYAKLLNINEDLRTYHT